MDKSEKIKKYYELKRKEWIETDKFDRLVFDNFKRSTRHGKGEKYNGNFKDFKNRMESMFTEGMSWQNHGEWHIDHIVPISKGGPNNLTNIQPLWRIENLSKGSKLIQ